MVVKEWWKSKTVWFNVVAVAVFIAGYFGYADFEPDPELMALVAAIVNLVLRWFTTQPIKE